MPVTLTMESAQAQLAALAAQMKDVLAWRAGSRLEAIEDWRAGKRLDAIEAHLKSAEAVVR